MRELNWFPSHHARSNLAHGCCSEWLLAAPWCCWLACLLIDAHTELAFIHPPITSHCFFAWLLIHPTFCATMQRLNLICHIPDQVLRFLVYVGSQSAQLLGATKKLLLCLIFQLAISRFSSSAEDFLWPWHLTWLVFDFLPGCLVFDTFDLPHW